MMVNFMFSDQQFLKMLKKNKLLNQKTSHPKRGAIASKEINPLTEKIKKTLKSLSDLPEDAKKDSKP